MNMEWRNLRLTKLSKWLLLLLLVVTIGSAAYSYFYIYKKTNNTFSDAKNDKKYSLSLYTYIQDEKAHIAAYDPKTSKHYEILTLDWKDKDKYYRFNASYSSASDKIVYSTTSGINIYDLKTKEQKELLKNYKGEKETDIINYFSPKWSNDSKKIVYLKGGYEGATYGVMEADGSGAKDIEGDGYSFAWDTNSTQYAIGSSAGMSTGPGINVSLSSPTTKTKQVLSTKELRDVESIVWLNRLYFSGAKQNVNQGDNNLYQILSVNSDGSDVTILDKDEYNNQSLISDGAETLYYTKYIAKSADNQRNSAGIYSIKTDGSEKTAIYQDGDKQVVAQAVDGNFIAIKSTTNDWSSEAIKTLLLFDKTSKKTSMVGEATNINFFDWIKSNKLPEGLVESPAPKPTEAELKAYSDSLKTHGYLSSTFYDYCWDYDCQSQTYPYQKIKISKTPEIITISQKPNLLYGNVSVPVIFFYDTTPFTEEQISLLKNKDVKSTYGYFEKWVNDQAKKANVGLNFSFDYKTGKQLQVEVSCMTESGTQKLLNQACMKDKIIAAYPDLKDKKVFMVALSKDNDKNYNYFTNYNYAENSIVYTRFDQYYMGKPVTDLETYLGTYQNGVDYYSAKQFIAQYGAKDKTASYKKPIGDAQSACYIDNKTDVTCGVFWKDRTANVYEYIKLDTAEISEVTQKEIGWYDADSDGKLEVNDKCPFNKNNDC